MLGFFSRSPVFFWSSPPPTEKKEFVYIKKNTKTKNANATKSNYRPCYITRLVAIFLRVRGVHTLHTSARAHIHTHTHTLLQHFVYYNTVNDTVAFASGNNLHYLCTHTICSNIFASIRCIAYDSYYRTCITDIRCHSATVFLIIIYRTN